jgi:hypothetical protein
VIDEEPRLVRCDYPPDFSIDAIDFALFGLRDGTIDVAGENDEAGILEMDKQSVADP